MVTEIRVPADEHREQIARCLSRSMNFPLDRALRRAPNFALEDMRCAFEGDQVVATAAEHHFLQWFGGRAVHMSGIWGVATLPEHRSTGLATAAVRRLLVGARERGDSLSALFPAVARPYRRLGYEIAGTFTDHRVPLDSLPSIGDDVESRIELADISRDLDDVKRCYTESARHHNGPLDPLDDRWWTRRIFDDAGDGSFTAVVARSGERMEGFATFTRQNDPGHLDLDFGLECSSFVAVTEPALRALLHYFRGFRGLGRWVEWTGPPQDPVMLLIEEQDLVQTFRYHWMLRLLDVPGALSARGWPAIDAEATIAVDDPMFPENAGPWRLSVRAGEAAVERAPSSGARPIPIGALSSMYSGFLRIPDAVRLGVVERDDPAVPALTGLLSGPDPWSPFFF